MRRNSDTDDDFDEDEDDSWDTDDDADDPTAPCIYCGEAIYEDSERCPACGRYQSKEDVTASSQPRWVIITAVILLAALALAFLR